jgi:Zn-dependent membrane protease YugP
MAFFKETLVMMWWGWFDPVYLLFLAPGILLAMWAQWRVQSAYATASEIPARSGYSGAEAADALLRSAGVVGVEIEPTSGMLSDHYVPKQKILRLSGPVYSGRSLAALGIAAHESGHAMQEASHYSLLGLRNFLVPAAGIGSQFSWIVLMIGFGLASMTTWHEAAHFFINLGIFLFSGVVLFQLVNLPVEFDASRRARTALLAAGLVTPDEDVYVKRVLNAAALTYVAATLTSVLTLLYFLYRAGLLGGRRR